MKRIILIFNILATVLSLSNAQNEEYKTTMKEIVDSIQSAKWGTDLTPYANQLERVASVETKEWLPNYWAAYCYMNKSYSEPVAEKKDVILEKAETLIAAAEKIMPNNDEIEVLKANIASARMAVDPQNRWQKYGAISGTALGAAQKLNPENPRAKLLEAQSIFYTPEAFGGGKQKALPLIKAALEKFEKFKPTSDLMPNWGLILVKYMLIEAEKSN
jgi:hypothetical protein